MVPGSADNMVALRHLDDFTLASDGSGFCNWWRKKWFLGLISAPYGGDDLMG